MPRIGTEVKVFFSDSKVFTEVDIGATAATLSRPEIVSISERERLDCWKVLEEVNSSMILGKNKNNTGYTNGNTKTSKERTCTILFDGGPGELEMSFKE